MTRHTFLGLLPFLLLVGCATQPVAVTEPEPESKSPAPAVEDEYWWYVRFRLPWPEGETAAWHYSAPRRFVEIPLLG